VNWNLIIGLLLSTGLITELMIIQVTAAASIAKILDNEITTREEEIIEIITRAVEGITEIITRVEEETTGIISLRKDIKPSFNFKNTLTYKTMSGFFIFNILRR
jgi:hypothetical protein